MQHRCAMGRAETASKYRVRAEEAFARAVADLKPATTAMMADHSAKGRLQSGATIKAAINLFEEHSKQALDQVQPKLAS